MTLLTRRMQKGHPVASGAAVTYPVEGAEIATVGDSITNYGNAVISLAGATITRDTNGLVTIVHTGLAPPGDSMMYIVNVLPTSLMAMGVGKYVDTATYQLQTSVTGAPLLSTDVTINPTVSGVALSSVLTLQAKLSGRGIFFHLQALAKGSLKFKGNYGKQGATSEIILDAVQKAAQAVAPGHFVLIMDGINSVTPKGPDDVPTTIAARQANIDAIVNAGRVALVCRIKPVDASFASSAAINANVQLVNTAVAAYCNGTTKIDLDTFGSTWNGSTGAAANTTIAGDFLHPTWYGSFLDAAPVWAGLSPKVVTHDLLPTTYNGTSVVPFATYFRIVGPYTAAPGYATSTSGFLGGGSGTRPSAPFSWVCGAFAGSPTAVMSVIDPGDGKGQAVQVLSTALAANDKTVIRPDSNGGITLTTLGLVAGDRFIVFAEVTWSNYTASNCNLLELTCTAGVFADGAGGELITQSDAGATFESDSGTKTFETGVITVPTAAVGSTTFTIQFLMGFGAASGSALNTQLRRVGWAKVVGPV